MTYYGGICDTSPCSCPKMARSGRSGAGPGTIRAKFSAGLWYEPGQLDESGEYAKLEEGHPAQTARFVRIQAERAGLILHEVAFIDEDGAPYPIASYATGATRSAPAIQAPDRRAAHGAALSLVL